MRKNILTTILLFLLGISPLANSQTPESPVSLSWELLGNNPKKNEYQCVFTLKNIGKATLGDNWKIYYNSFPRKLTLDSSVPVEVSEVRPGYYKITPKKGFSLKSGQSKKITYTAKGSLKSASYAPDGGHFAFTTDSVARPLDIDSKPIEWGTFPTIPGYPTAKRIFALNEEVNPIDICAQTNHYEILPGLKSVSISQGAPTDLSSTMAIYATYGLDRELEYANRELTKRFNLKNAKGVVNVTLKLISASSAGNRTAATNNEYYEIAIGGKNIEIRGVSADAVMNGVKSLAKIIDRNINSPIVPGALITDWPDLQYRGMMLDIVRNYSTPDNVKRLIDKLASYKINRLHLHFIDDEAWRIEIPSIPELTEVGARRGMTETEDEFLCQFYAGNGNPNDLTTTSNGHLSKTEFIDLLRYAYARGVEIVPEIESPGHARAAIVSMKARYKRLIATNPEEAERYRVWDPEDTSVYTSAQGYHDNVLNPAAEGTFRLMEKVVDEIILMYREANVPLPYIHVGGDEVPKNPWKNSPAVQKLMAEKGFKNTHDVEEYFISRIADMVSERGYQIGGWQEAAMRHSEATDRSLRPKFAGVNVWNTIPEWKGDTVAYAVANNGYNVILCNVGNFYLDMSYNAHPAEGGLTWGGYVDEYRSWDARPFDIYKSSTETITGLPLDQNLQKNKLPLLPEARKRIIGVQAQLFAETIRNFGMVESYIFPKIFGLVERGWNAEPLKGQSKPLYNKLIGSHELPMLQLDGYNFHLGMPGIKEENGMLIMNKPYDEAEVRYTTDGSEPNEESTLWSAPVKAKGKVVKAKLFYLGNESNTTRLER